MNYRKTFNHITLFAWSTIAVMVVMCSAIKSSMAGVTTLFKAGVYYSAGYNPSSLAIGDLNGDAKLDLAVANIGKPDEHPNYYSSVSVLLGNGDGSFQSAMNYGAGSEPSSLAIGDLNGDAKPDLAVANRWSDDISVLLGNGDGSFQSAMNYSAGDYPFFVAIGDLNGDAKPDLAAANYGKYPNYDFSVSVLLGNGDGSFQSAMNYGAGSEPSSLAIGDLNGDAKPDLVVANEGSDDVSVLLGNGDGSFQSAMNHSAGDYPSSVAIGDLNGDAKPDLAVANRGSDDVSVLLGNGDGSFQSAMNYGVGSEPSSVAIGDLNGDAKPDLAMANRWSADISVLLGNGDGSFQNAMNYWVGSARSSVAIGDLNGDAKPDLAVTGGSSNDNVSVLINIGGYAIQILNDFVSLEPDPFTFAFTPDTAGCPPVVFGTWKGKFSFDATLTNISEKELSYLAVKATEMKNGNLLLTDEGLIGEGEQFEISKYGNYADGILGYEECVDVPFTVCLNSTEPFRFFVDVFGATDTRFFDMGDGTIRDNDSGLIWLKNASCPDLNQPGGVFWWEARDAAAALRDGTCGLTDGSDAGDWKLPTPKEWRAFMSTVYDNPALINTRGNAQWSEGDAFTGVLSVAYWSDTYYSHYLGYAADMYDGTVPWVYYEDSAFVWPVRGGN